MNVTPFREELRAQRRLLHRLARALYKHTRTDLSPDAALSEMRKLVDEIAKKGKRR